MRQVQAGDPVPLAGSRLLLSVQRQQASIGPPLPKARREDWSVLGGKTAVVFSVSTVIPKYLRGIDSRTLKGTKSMDAQISLVKW